MFYHRVTTLDESVRDETYTDRVSPAVVWDNRRVEKPSASLGSGISV